MKRERGTKWQTFEEVDKSSKEANVVQIKYKYSCQEWNLLEVF